MSWFQKIAVPIWSDYIGDLFHQDLRQNAPKKTEILVYHGTSSKKLARILQSGFLVPSPPAKSYQNSSEGIFVTTSMMGAEMYAWHSAQNDKEGDDSDEVILELQVPLNWIVPDPDDSRVNITNIDGKEVKERNQASYEQGRILRPVNVKRIKQVKIISQYMLDEWMPIGKMLDMIQRLSRRNQELPEEYLHMINVRPRGLSRSEPYEDYEQRVASHLLSMYQTFFMPEHSQFAMEKVLSWVYKNNVNTSAQALLPEFIKYMSDNMYNEKNLHEHIPSEYRPKPHESLSMYAQRIF